MIVGIRPESFEDARLVGDARDRGVTFKAKIDLVESMGSEQYAHFEVGDDGIESEELAELAEDSGLAETPSGGEGTVVARLDAASKIRRGEEAELWVDASKLHLFDPARGGGERRLGGADQPASASRRRGAACLGHLLEQPVDEGVVARRRLRDLLAQAGEDLARPRRGCAAAGSGG